jgi:hypothetical protein
MLNQEQPPEEDSPFGAAILGSIGFFILIHWAAFSLSPWIKVWWTEWLVNPLIPMAMSFYTLYPSCWHPEIIGLKRILILILLSGGILVGELIFFGFFFMMLCAVCAGFSRWHY